MPKSKTRDKSLAEAAAKFVDAGSPPLSRDQCQAYCQFEDEDFTFEVAVPRNLSVDEVLDACHKECIKVEDEYDLFILPHVIHVGEQAANFE